MNESAPQSVETAESAAVWTPISFWRLAAKELRETLRDRRTIITLFLMPLIVYPILSLLFQGFIATGFQEGLSAGGATEVLEDDQFVFLFEDEDDLNRVAPYLNQGYVVWQRQRLGWNAEDETGDAAGKIRYDLFAKHVFQSADPLRQLSVPEMVELQMADVGVLVSAPQQPGEPASPVDFRLYYREEVPRSIEAVRLLEGILEAINTGTYRAVLSQRRIRFDSPIRVSSEKIKPPPAKKTGISFATLIPLVLTLMTITGAVYPAIDLTAGERERGTLESLIAAPIPRRRILLGKLVAIVAVAMLTAVVNLVGMTITLWVFQFDRALFGEQGLTWLPVLQIFGLLMLFAIFFSSVLLVLTSFARSFKEGQAYLIPLMMVALAPSLMSLKPDLQLSGLWTVTPLVNIVLLARDVLNGAAVWSTAIVTIATTAFYSVLAITMAARFFGTAQVLYGTDQGIGTLFKRPREHRPHASASLALLCLALLFPASFLWQGVMIRMASQEPDPGDSLNQPGTDAAEVRPVSGDIDGQLWVAALGLVVVFFLIPFLMAWYHRVRLREGFGVVATSLVAFLAAALMGLGFGPLLLQAIAWCGQFMQQAGLSDEAIGESLVQRGEERVQQLRNASFWLVLFAMAVVPAICEELFFRGLLFRAIRSALSPWKTIFATAILFGAFHLISGSGLTISRLLPTTLMGILLGWVCYRSGSVLPGILLHGLHNAITVCVAYFSDEMVARGWISEDQTSVPVVILMVAGVLAAGGVGLLAFRKRPPATDSPGTDAAM